MLKIHLDNNWHAFKVWKLTHPQKLVFDWDINQNYTYVDDLKDANVIALPSMHIDDTPTIRKQYEIYKEKGFDKNYQNVITLGIFHAEERTTHYGAHLLWNQWTKPNGHIHLTLNCNPTLHNCEMFYDFMFDFTKMDFTEYESANRLYNLNNREHSTIATGAMYELEDIKLSSLPKHYLAIMRTYEGIYPNSTPRFILRKSLRDFLDHSKGYVSNHAKGIFIEPQEYTEDIKDNLTSFEKNYAGGKLWPAHNRYYQDSIVSIYIETITYNYDYRFVSEKTFFSLIKGHFILPFGYRGLIEDIKKYGFILPDWIDYSYDTYNDDERFKKYLESVDKIQKMDIQKLIDLWHRDKYMLEHNRNLFYTTPRTSMVQKIIDKFKL